MKKNMAKWIWVVLWCLPLLALSKASDQSELKAIFHQASDAYLRQEFAQAKKLYLQLVEAKVESAAVYYNLGNSYFRENQLGEAIFYFKLAQKLAPRNANIAFNLDYARSKTQDKIEANKGHYDYAKKVMAPLNLKESYLLLCGLVLLFVALSAGTRAFSHELLKWAKFVSVFGLFYLALGVFCQEFLSPRFGVVVNSQANVYSGASKQDVVLFNLKEGSELEVKEVQNKNWARILLSDGKQGWVQTNAVLF